LPYLDGRNNGVITPITNPLGTHYPGWKPYGKQPIVSPVFNQGAETIIVSKNYHDVWIPHANYKILTPDKRKRWSPPPDSATQRNTQVEEKSQIWGTYALPSYSGLIDLIFISGKGDPGDKSFQSSLIREQELSSLIPDTYNNVATGSKEYIRTKGKSRTPSPNQVSQAYGGSQIVTLTYSRNGKDNSFKDNDDDVTFTPIGNPGDKALPGFDSEQTTITTDSGVAFKKHSARDAHYGGATLAGLRGRGLIR